MVEKIQDQLAWQGKLPSSASWTINQDKSDALLWLFDQIVSHLGSESPRTWLLATTRSPNLRRLSLSQPPPVLDSLVVSFLLLPLFHFLVSVSFSPHFDQHHDWIHRLSVLINPTAAHLLFAYFGCAKVILLDPKFSTHRDTERLPSPSSNTRVRKGPYIALRRSEPRLNINELPSSFRSWRQDTR